MILEAAERREVRDLAIPLAGKGMPADAVATMVNPLIQQELRRAARAGWELDGTSDAAELWRTGRLACSEQATFWSDRHTYSVHSVTIRVRRISTA